MPISDQPGTEDQLYQEFLAWKGGQGFGGGGFGNPWATGAEAGTSAMGTGGGDVGGSSTIARGSKQAGGGAGSNIVEQFNQWASSMNQPALTGGQQAPPGYIPQPGFSYGGGPEMMDGGMGGMLGGTLQSPGAMQGVLEYAAGGGGNMFGNFMGVTPASAFGAAGTVANIAGAPPAVGMGLSGVGNVLGGFSSGATAAQTAGLAAAEGGLGGGSSLGTGLGSGAAGGLASGAAAGVAVAIEIAKMINANQQRVRYEHQGRDIGKLMGAYEGEYQQNPQNYQDVANNLERGIYTQSRVSAKDPGYDYDVTGLRTRNQSLVDYLLGQGQQGLAYNSLNRGLAWTPGSSEWQSGHGGYGSPWQAATVRGMQGAGLTFGAPPAGEVLPAYVNQNAGMSVLGNMVAPSHDYFGAYRPAAPPAPAPGGDWRLIGAGAPISPYGPGVSSGGGMYGSR